MVASAIAIVIQYEKPALAKLCAPVKEKTWRWVIPIVIITIVVTFATIFLGQALGIQSVANGALDGPGTVGQKLFQLALVCVSLIGEEMFTAVMTLPFTCLWKKSDSLTTAIVAHILYDVILFLPEIFS